MARHSREALGRSVDRREVIRGWPRRVTPLTWAWRPGCRRRTGRRRLSAVSLGVACRAATRLLLFVRVFLLLPRSCPCFAFSILTSPNTCIVLVYWVGAIRCVRLVISFFGKCARASWFLRPPYIYVIDRWVPSSPFSNRNSMFPFFCGQLDTFSSDLLALLCFKGSAQPGESHKGST